MLKEIERDSPDSKKRSTEQRGMMTPERIMCLLSGQASGPQCKIT